MSAFGEQMHETDAILDKLDELDIMCEMKGIDAQILILGGAGLLLLMEMHKRKFRPTRDIDVLDGVVEVPPMEDFKDKEKLKIEDAGFQCIEVFVPTIELLACTKIFSKREKDLQDLRDTDLLAICNKEELMEMVDEYKDYLLNPNDPDLNAIALRIPLPNQYLVGVSSVFYFLFSKPWFSIYFFTTSIVAPPVVKTI